MKINTSAVWTERSPIAILGVPFDNVSTAETITIIGQMIKSGKPHYGATANVDFIVQAMKDVELRRILFDAHLVLADGMPIVWASKLLSNPLPERVTGSGMIPQLLEVAEQKGWKVFFLGGTEQSVSDAAKKTRLKHPRLQLVGAYSPPFKPLLEMNHTDILRRIHEAKPDILLVAFGCPKQEKWINMNYRESGVPFTVGVGATIDFLAGTFKRAPVWMQKSGTEWIFRMLQEPKRLAGRYGNGLRVFTFAIFQQLIRLGVWRPTTAAKGRSEIAFDTKGNLYIKAPERLGADEVNLYQNKWLSSVESGHVMFDLTETISTDSTGVGMLIRLRKRSRELGFEFCLIAPRPPITASLRMMKLDEFFSIHANTAAAQSMFNSLVDSLVVSSVMLDEQIQIRWHGEVNATNAHQIASRTELELAQRSPKKTVLIDLALVTFVDSTGIGLMLRLKKKFKRLEINLQFANPNNMVSNVLRHTRLTEYLLDKSK